MGEVSTRAMAERPGRTRAQKSNSLHQEARNDNLHGSTEVSMLAVPCR